MERVKKRITSGKKPSVVIPLLLVMLAFLATYLVFRTSTLFYEGYGPMDRIFSVVLLIAEVFLFLQILAYAMNVIKSTRRYKVVETRVFESYADPLVSCLICTYNEPKEVVEETVLGVINLDYPNKEVFIVDDSQGKFRKQIDEIAKKYSVGVIRRENRKGFKAGALNNALKHIHGKYIAIFDADQSPRPEFLRDLVSIIEEDKGISFVQTPQSYRNDENLIARAADQNQRFFYNFVCEGKSTSNSVFCVGSNFIIRRAALEDVGGFDEDTVTEDFATSFKLHRNGWKSVYYDTIYVHGIGPETVLGYLNQQYRWAHGTSYAFRRILKTFFTNPRALTPQQWWEYLISGSYYFGSLCILIILLSPTLFVFFGVRPLIMNPVAYGAAFLPYFIFNWLFSGFLLRKMGYKLGDLLLGGGATLLSVPVWALAFIRGIAGSRARFVVTSKARGEVPLRFLWPQLLLFFVVVMTAIVASFLAMETGDPAYWINAVWCYYNSSILSYIFIFIYKSPPPAEEEEVYKPFEV